MEVEIYGWLWVLIQGEILGTFRRSTCFPHYSFTYDKMDFIGLFGFWTKGPTSSEGVQFVRSDTPTVEEDRPWCLYISALFDVRFPQRSYVEVAGGREGRLRLEVMEDKCPVKKNILLRSGSGEQRNSGPFVSWKSRTHEGRVEGPSIFPSVS